MKGLKKYRSYTRITPPQISIDGYRFDYVVSAKIKTYETFKPEIEKLFLLGLHYFDFPDMIKKRSGNQSYKFAKCIILNVIKSKYPYISNTIVGKCIKLPDSTICRHIQRFEEFYNMSNEFKSKYLGFKEFIKKDRLR